MRPTAFLWLIIHLAGGALSAQQADCTLSIRGRVIDRGTGIGLMYANVYIEETGGGAMADSSGTFFIRDLCPGPYHIRVSHIGCEVEYVFMELVKDTALIVNLHHHSELLDELVVRGHREDRVIQASNTIGREEISLELNKNLSNILENVAGVRSLKTGSGISKPIIHGLYGNRVAILNNGILQSGQQWGNDHAPEIDPFIADHISVVKGASALAYGGTSLGGVILVEPGSIAEDPHIHGEVNYNFETNGLGHTFNSRVEKFSKWAAWRVLGTIKAQGDTRSADYYLTNTGKREYNAAAQLEKKWMPNWDMRLWYSLFHADIGILRGSHIGNVTDLEEALARDVPFFTKDYFSYRIAEPRQRVTHHLVKLESAHFISDDHAVKVQYGGQVNDREEYDVRRSGRSDIPALSLKQQTHFLEAVYNGNMGSFSRLKSGVQYQYTYNQNDPETGILPLIPDYVSHDVGLFAIYQNEKERFFYEFGARYGLTALEVFSITQTVPREIVRYDHLFHNYGFSGGLNAKVHEKFSLALDAGYTQRAPAVNELYSSGLHQGVSGIEEGRNDLEPEHSVKVLLSGELRMGNILFFEALAYFQNIWDYIYLEPQDELRLTIRGAFPVFLYEQTDARLAGTDLTLSVAPDESTKFIFKYSLVRGHDIAQDLALINMPSDNVSAAFTYSVRDGKKWMNNSISLDGMYVFRQNQLDADQDYVAPPDGYFLLGLSAHTEVQMERGRIGLSLAIENILNRSYRDYLNRMRYFADDTGINVAIGLHYNF